MTYINEPKHLVNPIRDIRLFDNWFLEMCSKAAWYVIPIAYSPWFAWTLWQITIWSPENSVIGIFLQVLIGLFIWTLFEYFGHRFLFHGEDWWMKVIPQNKWVLTGHFMIHGIHHAFPQDRYRLVFPPVPGYVLMYNLGYRFCRAICPDYMLYTVWLGFLIGYLMYDEMHYFMHHSSPESGYMKEMKVYHMQHHYKFGTIGFGVSNKFWDIVIGTEIKISDKNTKSA